MFITNHLPLQKNMANKNVDNNSSSNIENLIGHRKFAMKENKENWNGNHYKISKLEEVEQKSKK